MQIYLAGPIHGRQDAAVVEWRETFTVLAQDRHYKVRNPLDRDYRGREIECINEIILLDKLDIQKSDVVVVMWDGVASVGTSMEVFYAHSILKPIVLIDYYKKPMSPWLTYHVTRRTDDMLSALSWIEKHVK